MPQKMSDRRHTWRRARRSVFVRGLAAAMLMACGALAATFVATVALGATATTGTSTSTTTTTTATKKVSRSYLCKAEVSKYDPRTWACTTITVNPWQVNAGDTTSVTYAFKAKKALRYVSVCFGKVSYNGTTGCAYKHKFRRINRGRVIKRVFQMAAPMVQDSGTYRLDNLTSFYKRMKYEQRGAPYWETLHSTMCIIAASDPNYQCFG